MATLFRKTAKGLAEIETRAHRLPPRLRSALIVVDGKRSSDELRGMIPMQPDETLAALAEQGFIEAIGTLAPARSVGVSAPPVAAASTPALTANTTPVAAPLPPGVMPRPLDSVKRDCVRLLVDAAGPAADGLAMRIEKARSPEELLPLVDKATDLVAAMRGGSAAVAFRNRLGV